jgi:hypothetical protein
MGDILVLIKPTNNQVFYSQASWGKLEMKPTSAKKTETKTKVKEGGEGNIK